jgi:4-diphosphocytidyl-2-C-methyl-D-erythritol kinase
MITLQSPAKVNFFLRVVGKFPDGRPKTIVLSQAVDLCDTLHIDLHHKDVLECSDPNIPQNYANSVLQAAELFRRKTAKNVFLKIKLDKRIPLRAGLCGRSSNAATTLWGINLLAGKHVDPKDLKNWSQELVQDSPFFFSAGTSFNRGNEDENASLGKFPKKPLFIAAPNQQLPNAMLYKRLRMEEIEPRDVEAVIENAIKGKPTFFNDLEEPAFAIFPKLALLREKLLQAGFEQVIMTGAGPSLVCHGSGIPLQIPDVKLFKVKQVNRALNGWY